MKKRSVLPFLLVCINAAAAVAQQPPGCGTDALMQHLRTTEPHAVPREHGVNEAIRASIMQGLRGGDAPFTIPVVVHIIHDNGNENISDALVQQGIADLNAAFANSGAYHIPDGVDTQIQFCLAQQDPDGLPTTGITRHVSPLTELFLETQDLQLKNIQRWDPARYLNIWLVREITSVGSGPGVAGYAYFPQAHGGPNDGIVNEARWFGSSTDNSKIHIHEAGHYLGLYHTFEGGCTNNDCLTDGDRVCDTPPDASTTAVNCGETVNTCTTDADDTSPNNPFRPVALGGFGDRPDLTSAYMDYGLQACQDRFTPGQAERMSAALTTVRASLLASDGCLSSCGVAIFALGMADGAEYVQGQSAAITPNVQATVPVNYSWSVDGGVLSTATAINADMLPFGTHVLTLTLTNPDGNCSVSASATFTVRCSAPATLTIAPTSIQPGAPVTFTANAPGNQGLEWFIDDVSVGTGSPFQTSFPEAGLHNVFVVAFNGSCHDTSAVRPFMVGACTQGQYLNWMLLGNKRISFATTPPTVSTVWSNPVFHINEGYSAISDLQGQPLLYTTGQRVWGPNHQMMPNGDSLWGGGSSIQAALIVPNPAMNGLYYVFTTDHNGGLGEVHNGGKFAYSVVDMALNNGNGDVTLKNVELMAPVVEKLTAVRHCNGHDIWVITHGSMTNGFHSFLVTDAGVQHTSVDSYVGLVHDDDTYGIGTHAIGYMKASPMGDRIAYTAPYSKIAEVLRFDCSTGEVSDPVQLWQPQNTGYLGLEFSPDGNRLYVTEHGYPNNVPYLWQFTLATHDSTAIAQSRRGLGGPSGTDGVASLQLAPNDVIYIGIAGKNYYGAIHQPNELGNASQVQHTGAITGLNNSIGMQNNVVENRAARDVHITGPTQVCNYTNGVSYTAACAHPAKNQWIYNGPNTVVSSTAGELVMDFTTAGTDTLVAVKRNDCYGDRYDTLFIHVDLQLPLLPPDSPLCAGSTLELSPGSGFASVLWQDGSTAPTYTATGPGTYTVEVTGLGGCTLSDTVTLSELDNTLSLSLGNDTSFCWNQGLTLHVPPGHAPPYLWSTGDTTASIHHGATNASIWLQVTDADGCIARDTINLHAWSNQAQVTLGPDVELCPGEVLVLSSTLLYGTDVVYTWSNGTAGPSLTVWEPGTYWLTAMGPCGFGTTDTIKVVPCITTGTAELDAAGGMRVRPNPTDGLLHISLPQGEAVREVVVMNMLGQGLLRSTGPAGTVDLSAVAPGVYIVRVRTTQDEYLVRVVRE